MTKLDLSESIELEITAIKGDTFGPIQFIFEEAELFECNPDCECFDDVNYGLQDLHGAIFEGEIKRGTKIIHVLTDDELTFYADDSSLLLSLSEETTRKFPCSVLELEIRQITEDGTRRRIHGKLIFIN